MGEVNKLLLPWNHATIIRHSVEVCTQSHADEVLVVLGHQSLKVKNALQSLDVKFVDNPIFEKGMLSSIQVGIMEISPESEGWMIFLGDQPKLSLSLVNRLIEQFRKHYGSEKDLIVLPVCDGIRRNPVIFSKTFKQRLLDHQGEGGKALIESHRDSMIEVAVDDANLFEDVDTPQEYDLLKPE